MFDHLIQFDWIRLIFFHFYDLPLRAPSCDATTNPLICLLLIETLRFLIGLRGRLIYDLSLISLVIKYLKQYACFKNNF